MQKGLQYGTLWYRAPELLAGDSAWGPAVDVWSTALVWTEMLRFTPLMPEKSQLQMIILILRLFGAPEGRAKTFYESLPLWSRQFPAVHKPKIDQVMDVFLGLADLALLKRMLVWFPEERPLASAALGCLVGQGMPDVNSSAEEVVSSSSVVVPEPSGLLPLPSVRVPSLEVVAPSPSGEPASLQASLALDTAVRVPGVSMALVSDRGRTRFVGDRGEFNLLEGTMTTAVLEWLRADPVFHEPREWSFEDHGLKDRAVEAGVKLELVGHLGENRKRPGLSLNSKVASSPMWGRFRHWSRAFRLENANNFTEVQAGMLQGLAVFTPEELGINGRELVDDTMGEWVADLGATQVMAPTDRTDPVHFDGGASFFHLGLTLWGHRTVHLHVAGGDVDIQAGPGHVYGGCLCCARHYVQHHSDTADLLHHHELGDVEVALLARSRVFRGSRASTTGGPNPHRVFRVVLPVLVDCVEALRWNLPSIEQCLAAEAADNGGN
jgi:hypothetical protein